MEAPGRDRLWREREAARHETGDAAGRGETPRVGGPAPSAVRWGLRTRSARFVHSGFLRTKCHRVTDDIRGAWPSGNGSRNVITTRSSEERRRLPLAPARRGRAAASGDAGDDPHRSGGCRRPRETGPHLRSGSFCPCGIRITGRQRLPVPRLRGGPRGPLCVPLAPRPRTVPAAPALLACSHSESRVPQGPPCCLCSSLPAARTRSLHDPAGRVSPVSHAKWRLKKVLFPSDPVDLSFDRPRPERLAGPASPPSPHGPVPGPGHSAASARHLRVC